MINFFSRSFILSSLLLTSHAFAAPQPKTVRVDPVDHPQFQFLKTLVKETAKLHPPSKSAKIDYRLFRKIAAAKTHAVKSRAYSLASNRNDSLKPYFDFRMIEEKLYELSDLNKKQKTKEIQLLTSHTSNNILRYAVEHQFPNASFIFLNVKELQKALPSTEDFEFALKMTPFHEMQNLCQWIGETAEKRKKWFESKPLKERFYASCLVENDPFSKWVFSKIPSPIAPTPEQQFQYAKRLHLRVQYTAALDVLSKIPNTKDTKLMCNVKYWTARTLYRLRQRDDAIKLYSQVVSSCPDQHGIRLKSLYSIGVRFFDTGKFDDAKKTFEQLVADFPTRSHADDAVMYLARTARIQKEPLQVQRWVSMAEQKYQSGDMFFEIIWEDLEPLFRAGKFKEFLNKLDNVSLPSHDNHYYSQGRLEYFRGNAYEALKENDAAISTYIHLLRRYPFSFYGYLAYAKLRSLSTLSFDDLFQIDATPPSWLDATFTASPIFQLLRAGLYNDAAAILADSHKSSDYDQWQFAFALALNGQYVESHNVVRRNIQGRPWISDTAANPLSPTTPTNSKVPISWAQFLIARPLPFRNTYSTAAAAENLQAGAVNGKNPNLEVRMPLAPAITREESGFDYKIVSYAGAVGLMQLMPRTAASHDSDIDGKATAKRLTTPDVNIRVGYDHLHWLAKRFDGNPVLMIAAYNAGAGAVGKWLRHRNKTPLALFVEDIPYDQTRNYTKRVFGSYMAYQVLTSTNLCRTKYCPFKNINLDLRLNL